MLFVLSYDVALMIGLCRHGQQYFRSDYGDVSLLFPQGLFMNIKPEVCSALNVCPMEGTIGEEQQEPCPPYFANATDSTRSTLSCSARSSEISSCAASASTEELELLTELSRSSSEAEDSTHSSGSSRNSSRSPSTDVVPQLAWRPVSCSVEDNEVQRQTEEAYVTMSSFYQIK